MNAHKDLLARHTKHSHKPDESPQEEPPLPELGYGPTRNTPGELMAVAVWFQKFLHRDNGYLKVRREVDGDDVHFTWTWTYPPYQRSYVYVRYPYYQSKYALEMLERKLMDVEEGIRVPTPDRFNG